MMDGRERVSWRPTFLTTGLVAVALMLMLGLPQRAAAQWSASNNNINNTNMGNVGIGTDTTAPTEKLVTRGNVLFGGVFSRTELWPGFTSYNNPALLEINSDTGVSNDTRFAVLSLVNRQAGTNSPIGGIYFANGAITQSNADKRLASISVGTDGTNDTGLMAFGTRAMNGFLQERLRIDSAGNVGIGTSSLLANAKLNINRNGTNSISLFGMPNWVGVQAQALAGPSEKVYGSWFGAKAYDPGGNSNHLNQTVVGVMGQAEADQSLWGSGQSVTGVRGYAIAPPSALTSATNIHGGYFEVSQALNAGFGGGTTTNLYGVYAKAATLQNFANVGLYGVYIDTADPLPANHYGLYQATAAAKNYFAGSVGVGTTNPSSKLFVGAGQSAVATLPGLNVALGGDSYIATSNGVVNTFIGADTSAYGIVGTLSNHALGLRTNNLLRMTILATGNVGIGTANPTKALDVVGDVNASGTITGGNIIAKYQDVAEWVPSSQQLEAGTVVVLDPEKSNQVLASTKAYDTRVAGVVSTQPGIALGEAGANKVLVATTGRVKVRADATRAPIKVGDLLVTSNSSGMAMKSKPVSLGGVQLHRPGTLIGKALEPLDKGVGEILVLLSLQ